MLYVQAFGRLWGADGGGKAGRIGRYHHAGDDQGGDGDEDGVRTEYLRNEYL